MMERENKSGGGLEAKETSRGVKVHFMWVIKEDRSSPRTTPAHQAADIKSCDLPRQRPSYRQTPHLSHCLCWVVKQKT